MHTKSRFLQFWVYLLSIISYFEEEIYYESYVSGV